MRERKLQIVIKGGHIYARTTYVGLDGKRHAIWRAGKNKTEAKQNLAKALKDYENDEGTIIHAKKTFSDLAAWYRATYLIPPEYRDGRKIKGKRAYKNDRYLLNNIVPHLGSYKLRSITHRELEKFKDARLAAPIVIKHKGGSTTKRVRTIASVNRELMMIRTMLRKAQREGWLLKTPFEEHDSLISMADERRRERTLSYDEETRLLAACSGPRAHLRPLVVCALSTGMRRGELLKLEWPDVDLNKREITIISTNSKTLTRRTVPVSDNLYMELFRLRELSPDDGSVFGIVSNVKRSFRKACEIAGIKHGGIDGLTFHCLRHTAGTRMVKQGLELAEVARILGHSDIKTTYRYISADSDVMDRARKALGFRPPPNAQTVD